MEIMFGIILALIAYFVALYAAVRITVDKLGARSGLFGTGMATMFAGFLWHKLVEDSAVNGGYWYNEYGQLSLLYYVLFFGFLVMGLSGIVMMAVDILKAVNELTAWTVKKDIPTWKQIQTEQKTGTKE